MKKEQYLNWAKDKFTNQAKNILKSSDAVIDLIDSLDQKISIEFVQDQLRTLWTEIKCALSLLKDYASGQYKPQSKKNLILIVIALLYFLNPMDLIPDFLVGGLADDTAILGWIFTKVKSELIHYKNYKQEANDTLY